MSSGALASGHWPRKFLLAAVVLCHVAFVWSARNPGLLTGQDDAEYILIGRALSQGSYRELWRADAPIHAQYPPGYPAVLALSEAMGGRSYQAQVALMAILSAGTLLLLYATLRRRLAYSVAIASVVVLAVNPYLVQYAGEVASETPYTFFSVLCLYCLVRSEDAQRAGLKQRATAWFTAASVAGIVTSLTRMAGVALMGMVWLWVAFNRRWKAALLFTVAGCATTGSWLAWAFFAPEQFSGRSYFADVADDSGGLDVLRRIGSNAWSYGVESLPYSVAFPTVQGTVIDNVLGLLIVGLTLLVGIYVLSLRWREAAVYLLAYAAVLLVFRWQLTRFITPVLVLLVPCMLVGALSIADRLRPAWSRSVLIVLALALVWGGADRARELVLERGCTRTADIPSADCTTPEQARYFDALRYIRSALPDDAAFLAAKSGALYYYTGHKSISVEAARGQHPDDFLRFVTGQGADYVLLASIDGVEVKYFGPLLQANCERVRLVRSFSGGTLLLAVNPRRFPATAEGDACEALAEYRALNASRTL